MQQTDDLLRAIAHNAYELHYGNAVAAPNPVQQAINEFTTSLKPGYWVLETSAQRLWRHEIMYSIGRLIWRGKLPIDSQGWDGENEARPLDTYTLLQISDGNFRWWTNASFIRILSGVPEEKRLLSGNSEQRREVQRELDEQNLSWAKDIALEHRLSGLFDKDFGRIILDYARKHYDAKVSEEWHPWTVLSLFPARDRK